MADRKQSGNWNLWQDIPQAEIWEWVALSLNTEPKNLRGLDFRPIGGGSFPFDDCPAEFQRRITIALAHIEAGRLAVKQPGKYSWQDIVEKNIFVTWASNELKWKLPPKLVAMTQKQDESETAPAESKPQSESAVNAQEGPAFLDGEPKLQPGPNKRAKVDAWVKWQAEKLKRDDDNVDDLAERIRLVAEKYGYESERRKMTTPSIITMLPPGITGGRGKNRNQSEK